MLNNPTIDKLYGLRLMGMAKAYEEQTQMREINELDFEQRFGLLVDREMTERQNRRLTNRLKFAKLRLNASFEDIDLRSQRGLDKHLLLKLGSCEWIKDHQNVLLTGPTGIGKSYIACALANSACRQGYKALYQRLPRLFEELGIAKGDGRYNKLLTTFSKIDLLVLDDFGLSKLTEHQCRDLLEIMEDRHGLRSTIVTSQLPVKNWHDVMMDPTIADAILDRLVHNAYKIELTGESMKKQRKA
ncbi:MAG: IS21-like element helper ATPase IstB [bacterium]